MHTRLFEKWLDYCLLLTRWKVDVPNEQFIIESITGDWTSQHCLTSHVGAGSSSHSLHVARRSDAATSSAVTVVPKVSNGETTCIDFLAGGGSRSTYGSNFSVKERCKLAG